MFVDTKLKEYVLKKASNLIYLNSQHLLSALVFDGALRILIKLERF